MADSIKRKKIIIFTSPSCSWCNRVKDYLRQKRFSFKEIDVSKDAQAAADMVRKTGQQGVPVTLINGRPVVGFDRIKIDRLLSA